MNAKNLIAGGITGGIAYFFLGWIVYGIVLREYFPEPAGEDNLVHIALGSMSYGFLMGWVFQLNEGIKKCVPGIKAGIGIGLFVALHMTFFINMNAPTLDLKMTLIDTLAMLFISAIVGAIVGVINGKLS